MEILSAKELSFSYAGFEDLALNGIDMSVREGEFILLCGASGSGKTTLLRQFKPAASPVGVQKGKIKLCGKRLCEISSEALCTQIGFVGQSPDNQLVTDKVWHELAFGLEGLGLPNNEIRLRVSQTAAYFGIEKWYAKNVSDLSGGQKQLINLASVMTTEPKLLLLDEPTAQLDPIAANELLSAIERINRELGVTVIMTEHRLDEVMPMADRVLVMQSGKITNEIEPDKPMDLHTLSAQAVFSLPAAIQIGMALSAKKPTIAPTEARSILKGFVSENETHEISKRDFARDGSPVLNAENLWFRYQRDSEDVLKGINIKAYSGEILGIVGSNGSGKSTLLDALSGIHKCCRGKITLNGEYEKIAMLPQNPKALFVKKTLSLELSEMTDDNEKISRVAELCGLENLLDRNPFDLSGGETQRAALAKLLLSGARLLLLDEPTKGLDAGFKRNFGRLLEALAKSGYCIVIVSHDTDFCAGFCHRCAMLFNGEIVSECGVNDFFGSGMFYTTPAARIAKGILPNAVTTEEIITACKGNSPAPTDDFRDFNFTIKSDSPKSAEKQGSHEKRSKKIFRFASLAVFLLSLSSSLDVSFARKLISKKALSYALVFASAIIFALLSPKRNNAKQYSRIRRKSSFKSTAVSVITYFVAVPLTAFVGIVYLGDRKYMFISLLILYECLASFFISLEVRKPQARELVLIAVLCAIACAGRAAFYMLPQFKPVMAIVIVSGAALGRDSGFLVGAVSMLVSNIFFGQGPWTPWQMLAMGLVGFLAGLLFDNLRLPSGKASLAVFGFLSAIVIYGAILNPASAIISGTQLSKATLAACYAAGLPLDILHGAATMLFLYAGGEQLIEKLERTKIKYGLSA